MRLLVFILIIGAVATARASTLPPELKAYDFAEAYYIEDGGVVIAPYGHGFSASQGISTPEGIRIMPGGTFSQVDAGRGVIDEYRLVRLNKTGTRAFFHEATYRCKAVKNAEGKWGHERGQLLETNNFYLSQWRSLEWFDFAFDDIELHPSAQAWRTRPRF